MNRIVFDEKGFLILNNKPLPCIEQNIKIDDALKITSKELEDKSGEIQIIDGYGDRKISISCLIITNFNKKDFDINNWHRDFSKDDGAFEEALKRLETLEKIEDDLTDVHSTIHSLHQLFMKDYFFEIENELINSIDITKVVFTTLSTSLRGGENRATVELEFIEYDSLRIKTKEQQLKKEAVDNGLTTEKEAEKLTRAELEKMILQNEWRRGYIEAGGMSVKTGG